MNLIMWPIKLIDKKVGGIWKPLYCAFILTGSGPFVVKFWLLTETESALSEVGLLSINHSSNLHNPPAVVHASILFSSAPQLISSALFVWFESAAINL